MRKEKLELLVLAGSLALRRRLTFAGLVSCALVGARLRGPRLLVGEVEPRDRETRDHVTGGGSDVIDPSRYGVQRPAGLKVGVVGEGEGLMVGVKDSHTAPGCGQ